MLRRIAAGAAVSALMLSACIIGSDGDSGDEASGDGGGDSSALGTGDAYSVTGALTALPAPADDEFEVRTADLATASELSGLDRPTSVDKDTVLPWAATLTGMPVGDVGEGEEPEFGPVPVVLPEMTNPVALQRIAEFDELAGWSLIDVDAYAETVTVPPSQVAVLSGDFDDSTLADLRTVKGSVRTVGTGRDNDHDLDKATAVSQTGQPIRMAEKDGQIVVSPATDIASEWLEGPDETMADHPSAGALAEALDDAEVVSAKITVGSEFRDTPSSLPGDTSEGDLPTHAFDAVGIGWSAKGGEPVIVVTYHFEDADAATQSVAPLKRVFEEGRDMRGEALSKDLAVSEISSDGPVVTATLSAEQPNAQHTIIRRLDSRDLPFAHE